MGIIENSSFRFDTFNYNEQQNEFMDLMMETIEFDAEGVQSVELMNEAEDEVFMYSAFELADENENISCISGSTAPSSPILIKTERRFDSSSSCASSVSFNSAKETGSIRIRASYSSLKKSLALKAKPSKHLNDSTTSSVNNSSLKLKDKRFRSSYERVRQTKKFYQRQRTSSKLNSLDLSEQLIKLKENNFNKSNQAELNISVNTNKPEKNSLKLYKPSFKVEKLLNDSRSIKKYLIDYDLIMKPKSSAKSKAVSLSNLANFSEFEMNYDINRSDETIQNMSLEQIRVPASLMSSLPIQIEKSLEIEEDQNDCSSTSSGFNQNRCSSGYLSDF